VAAFRELVTAVRTGTQLPGYLSPTFIAHRASSHMVGEELAVLATCGVCPDAFNAIEPVADVVALPWKVGNVVAVNLGSEAVRNVKALLSLRQPLVVVFIVDPSFETPDEDGRLSLPTEEGGILGLHAVLVVGYDETGWIVRNSHGEGWGAGGYATMPYGYERCWVEAWTAFAAA
jgi:hypothetical protein